MYSKYVKQPMIHSFEFTIHALTTQQFFSEPNIVRDRYLTQEIYVEGSGEAIIRFKKHIESIISIWASGERIEFLREFARFLDIDEETVTEEGRSKFTLLDELPNEGPDIFFSLAISIPFSRFRQKQLQKMMNDLRTAISLPDELFKERYVKMLEFMDPDFSVLHNLYVLDKIAEITKMVIDPNPRKRLYALVLDKFKTGEIAIIVNNEVSIS